MIRDRRPLFAGNWKMYKTPAESRDFAAGLLATAAARDDRDVAVFPTTVSLPAVAEVLHGSHIACGCQNMHWEAEGAFTGEVSARSLVEIGCRYVLVGHSERRALFGETDGNCSRKVRAALGAGLAPVLCCGEVLAEREQDLTLSVVERQLALGLAEIAAPGSLVVAYEPVWAIGTGRNATPEQAAEVHSWIHDWLAGRFGAAGRAVRVIYGGSVKPANAAGLLRHDSIDGVLVGGASLDGASFNGIVACV